MNIEQRKEVLTKVIADRLPELLKLAEAEPNVVLLHQDAFAADYQEEEYYLLGAAIKYLGLKGKEVRIIGTNRETLS